MKKLSFLLIILNLLFYAGEIPLPMLSLCWILYIICFAFFRKFNETPRGKLIRRTVTTTGLVVGLIMIAQLFKPLVTVESTLSLLLILLTLKLYELENYDDYFHLFLITVLVQCGILLLNPTFFALVFSLFNIILTFIFVIKINQYKLGSINLRRLLLYLFPAIPLCFLLFFFFPRFTSGFMRLQNVQAVSSGMNAEINFSSLGPMTLDPKTIFRANLKEIKNLKPNELYWRTTVLWDTDGENWSEGHYSLKGKDFNQSQKNENKSLVEYQVVLDDLSQLFIPVLDRPVMIDLESLKIDYFRDQTFQFRSFFTQKKVFEVASNLTEADFNFDSTIQRKSLRVKRNRFPKLEETLANLYRGVESNASLKLERLKNFFQSNGFTYTLTPPTYQSVEDFILEGKSGYCSHFATSFALLARLSGIPARVVNGYQGGIYNELGNFYTIEGRDAHAWVEIYDENKGWTRFDPTELVYPIRISLGARASFDQLNPYLQFANLKLNRKNFEFNWFNQVRFFTSMVNNNLSTWFYEFDQDSQKFMAQKFGLKQKNLPVLLVALFMIALTIIYFVMKIYQSRKNFDPALKEYLGFIKKMENQGLTRHQYEGPLSFKERCLQHFPDQADYIEATINQFIERRYKQQISN